MATTKKNTDSITLDLMRQVEKQKKEISNAERPNWITNCSFSYTEKSSDAINIHVESNVRTLICIAAFLNSKEAAYKKAASILGVEDDTFTWGGFTTQNWIDDLKLRINKIQINSKKKKLEVLESRLNAIISPELKAQMELESIASELNS